MKILDEQSDTLSAERNSNHTDLRGTFLGGLLIPRTAAAYIVTVGFVLPGFGYLGEKADLFGGISILT